MQLENDTMQLESETMLFESDTMLNKCKIMVLESSSIYMKNRQINPEILYFNDSYHAG